MTKTTLAISDFLVENILWLVLGCAIPAVLAGRFLSTEKGRLLRDQYIWTIPVIGALLHKTSIEIFCRVFYALYSGSGENIEVIRMAAEASGNKYMEARIKSHCHPAHDPEGRRHYRGVRRDGRVHKDRHLPVPFRSGNRDREEHGHCSLRNTRERDHLQDEERHRVHPATGSR